jgi:DNA repair protein RadC
MQAGELLGIKLIDHIIIGNETDYVSLKAKGLL